MVYMIDEKAGTFPTSILPGWKNVTTNVPIFYGGGSLRAHAKSERTPTVV